MILILLLLLLYFHLFSSQLVDNIIDITPLQTPEAFSVINPDNPNLVNSFGANIEPAGDINNAGFPDAIIGRVNVISGQNFYVYYGSSTYASPGISELDNQAVDNTVRFIVTITDLNDNILPKGVGDVNNDGIDDMIVKVNIDTQDGYIFAFVIYGVEGQRPDIVIDNNNLDPNIGFRIMSDSISANKNDVAGFGDYNGDGIDDMAVSIDGGGSNRIWSEWK